EPVRVVYHGHCSADHQRPGQWPVATPAAREIWNGRPQRDSRPVILAVGYVFLQDLRSYGALPTAISRRIVQPRQPYQPGESQLLCRLSRRGRPYFRRLRQLCAAAVAVCSQITVLSGIGKACPLLKISAPAPMIGLEPDGGLKGIDRTRQILRDDLP